MLVHCVRRCGHRRGENGELGEEGGKTEVGIKKERGETWNDSSKTDGWTTCLFPGSCVNCGADFFCCYYSYFCVLPRAAVNESPMTRPLPPRTFVYPARQIAHELLNQACVLLCTSVHFQKLFEKTKESGRHSDKNVITDIYFVGTVKTHCVLIFFLCIRNDLVLKQQFDIFWGGKLAYCFLAKIAMRGSIPLLCPSILISH